MIRNNVVFKRNNLPKTFIFKLPLTILAGILIFSAIYFSESLLYPATANECPETMTDSQCLIYLQNKAAELNNQSRALKQALSDEEYNKLDIFSKIEYFSEQIGSTQNEIEKLEVDIETTTVEIRILNDDIDDLQNKIDTVTQEINKTKSSIQKRISLSYRFSSYTPIEVLFTTTELEGLLRQIRYLKNTRERDQELLVQMSEQKSTLDEDQVLLADKKFEVQERNKELEGQRAELFEERKNLDSQKATQKALYAESDRKIAEYSSIIDKNRIAQSALDEAISKQIAEMTKNINLADGTYVPAGTVIGYMGNTGYSFGAHLHFVINSGTSYPGWGHWWGDINPWGGYLGLSNDFMWQSYDGWKYHYINGAGMVLPLSGTVVLTQNHHQGMSIDLWSNMGEGAPVLAAMEGVMHKGVDGYGGKWVQILHPNGLVTGYLHLQ